MISLHISHTDIQNDSRILKEMDAVRGISGIAVVGIGIGETDVRNGPIRTVRNFSRRIKLRSHVLSKPLKMIALLAVYFRLLWRSGLTRAEVVHCHDWFVLPIGTVHSFIWSSILIYDAHELESDTNTRSRLRKRTAFFVERLCWKRINGFITVSSSILEWYNNNFGPKKNSAVVLNSPVIRSDSDTSQSDTMVMNLRRTYGIPRGKSLGVYLGGLETGRGLDIILEAVAGIPDQTHVLFIGYGSYAQTLQAKAEQMNCSNVTFVGRIPHDKVVGYINECDYGLCLIEPVSLSDVYSLPNKLFEYVHAGLYVFGSELPEIKKFLATTDFGTVIDSTPEALRKAISGENFPKTDTGLKTVPVEFGWPAQADAIRGLYNNALYKPN